MWEDGEVHAGTNQYFPDDVFFSEYEHHILYLQMGSYNN